MKRYTICVVDREYRYVEVEAEDGTDARDKVWQDLEAILRKEPDDIDTDIVIDHVEDISL